MTALTARAESWRQALREEMGRGRLAASLIASSIVALMTLVLSASFVALIFVSPLTGFVGDGTNLMLFTAFVMALFMVIFSSYPGTIAIPQDRIAPIIALMASLIVQQMKDKADVETIGVTVLAAIALCTVIVGLVLFLLGAYKLGNIVRFIPYPVIGGFLAGSGWLLIIGSFRVINGEPFSLFDLRHLYEAGSFSAWMPCVVFGTVAYLAFRYSRHYLTLPLLVFSAIILFYAWLKWGGHTLDEARSNGWILGAPPEAGFRKVHTIFSLVHADWLVVLNQYGSLGAILLTSIVSILLNTTALELAADEEIDLNRELRAAGFANVFGGLGGGMVGFQSLSLSALPISMGVRSRLVGLISAFACLAVLVGGGTDLLGYIPRFILGGILFYNGMMFLVEWTVDAYFRLQREDYFLIIMILAIVAMAGYLQGVGAGIIIATVLFVVKYSTVNVVSNVLSGDGHHSAVDRAPKEARLLHTQGAQIYILRLSGFIFFGSANSLLNTIRARNEDRSAPPLKYAVLDFQYVSGIDTSALVSISKLSRLAVKEGFAIIATSVSTRIQNSFRNTGLLAEGPGQLRLFHDRDHGIEWCENQIIEKGLSATREQARSLAEILKEAHAWRVDTAGLLDYAEQLDLEKNHHLIQQGDLSSELYFIESGRVKVVIELDSGRMMRVRTMGPGTVVGEIGLYLEQNRVASVVTEEKCRLYRLTGEALRRMEREQPELASAFHEFMVRVLAERVTQQNRTLRALVD